MVKRTRERMARAWRGIPLRWNLVIAWVVVTVLASSGASWAVGLVGNRVLDSAPIAGAPSVVTSPASPPAATSSTSSAPGPRTARASSGGLTRPHPAPTPNATTTTSSPPTSVPATPSEQPTTPISVVPSATPSPDPSSPAAMIVPSATPTASPSSPVLKSSRVPTPSSSASASPSGTPSPSPSYTVYGSADLVGGVLMVTCLDDQIDDFIAIPTDGWRSRTVQDGPATLDVRFEQGSTESRIVVTCRAGKPSASITNGAVTPHGTGTPIPTTSTPSPTFSARATYTPLPPAPTPSS